MPKWMPSCVTWICTSLLPERTAACALVAWASAGRRWGAWPWHRTGASAEVRCAVLWRIKPKQPPVTSSACMHIAGMPCLSMCHLGTAIPARLCHPFFVVFASHSRTHQPNNAFCSSVESALHRVRPICTCRAVDPLTHTGYSIAHNHTPLLAGRLFRFSCYTCSFFWGVCWSCCRAV